MKTCKIWVPTGALGAHFPDESIEYAISRQVDAIALDAGSTDSGPYYLGAGATSKPREVIKSDLLRLMKARQKLNVPLIIASCGTCGTDGMLDWTRDICLEIAGEENLDFRLALIYSEQDKVYLKTRLREGKIKPLQNASLISEEVIDSCTHIVGVMGTEPIIESIENDADIILGGRATDTAIIASVPIMRGISPGLAWHGAKIAECGALCSHSPVAGGVILHFDENGFEVETAIPDGICTPYSVAAHMLYENANPYELREPAGLVKTRNAHYIAIDHRRVRVEGSEFEPLPITIKIEGSGVVGYQTIIMSGITDPEYITNIDQWQTQLLDFINAKVASILKLPQEEYNIEVRRFGLDGLIMNNLSVRASLPAEILIMITVTAKTQETASDIVKLGNPYVLHMPLSLEGELPSFAFPFSPPQTERGPVYEFKLNHIVEPENYKEMIKNVYMNVMGKKVEKYEKENIA